ncbi:MAG TPA: hypothetical protein VMO47_14900 [Rhodothermales bacterium]|nr:hypothetical protein [Rhodothermales bacterium]
MLRATFIGVLTFVSAATVLGQDFQEATIDVGNVGVTVTNSGFIGRANVRNTPTGAPSFEYPLNSGVEHLFESGLWVGAIRSDGVLTVRTGAVTTSAGYQPGGEGYEMSPSTQIREFSTLIESDAYTPRAISHQDYVTSFNDTASFVPGTTIPVRGQAGRLGMEVTQTSHAWSFPFTEFFVIIEFDIANISGADWDSVYVGLWHDSVVRNVNTTTDIGSSYFNKGGFGLIDSLNTSYAFNAGGTEESLHTYGTIGFLGADWRNPATGQKRFWHPDVASEYEADGLPLPRYTARWWSFASNPIVELARPQTEADRYRRMGTPYPDPNLYNSQEEFLVAQEDWFERLRTDGAGSAGNWISLSSVGPFRKVAAGDTLRVTFALVAALKPEEFQDFGLRSVDNVETRAPLIENLLWARRTYRGEDTNGNGRLDPGEDANDDGLLTRYLIPEPPIAPRLRVELDRGKATLYWDSRAEFGRDPVTGIVDFEGYRVYASNPGDDLRGDVFGAAGLIAQYDIPSNGVGINNGFDAVILSDPVTFPGDTTVYRYALEVEGILSGWQYGFAVTAFDQGDESVGLPSFESSRVANAVRAFPGTPAAASSADAVGVYPNPYRINAAWDGTTSRTRKLNFYNLPARSKVRIYSLAGEIVAEFTHDAATYTGDIRWYDDFSAENRILSGGEHSWDLLSESGLSLSSGLYLFTVQDLDTSEVQSGKFAIIR